MNILKQFLKIVDWNLFSKIQLILVTSVFMDVGLLYMSFKLMQHPVANVSFLLLANKVLFAYIMIGSVLCLLGFFLKKINKFSLLYAHIGVNYNAISLMVAAFAIGIINITNGLIFIGSCLICMILIPKRVFYVSLFNTTMLFIGLIYLTVIGKINYAPALQPYVTFSIDIQNFYLVHSSIYMVFYSALIIAALSILLESWNKKTKHIERLYLTDSLTDVLNRRALDKIKNEMIINGLPQDYGLIVIDVDNFKHINDQYGHFNGDLVLKHVAQILKDNSRVSDSVIRYGGEEFLLLLKNTNKEDCYHIATRILKALNQTPVCLDKKQEFIVTASFGIAYSDDQVFDFDSLFKMADQQLYLAKSSGKNKICM